MTRLCIALVAALMVCGSAFAQGQLPSPQFTVGRPLGTASLDSNGTVPLSQIPVRALAAALTTVYIGSVAVTQPSALLVAQRDTRSGGVFGFGAGAVSLNVNPTFPASVVEYRLRDAAAPSTTLQDWSPGIPPLPAGAQIISFQVPASEHFYFIDLRFNSDNTSVVSTTNGVGVGEVIAVAGQSLAVTMVNDHFLTLDTTTIASLGLTISPYGVAAVGYANGAFGLADGPDQNMPPPFQLPADGSPISSAFVAEFLQRSVTSVGVPVTFVGYAVGGTCIDSWESGTPHYIKLANVLNQVGGKFGTIIWRQGHCDTKNNNTADNYSAQLTSLFGSLASDFPKWQLLGSHVLLGTIPAIGVYGNGPSAIKTIRDAGRSWCVAATRCSYIDGLDITLAADLVHPMQVGNIPDADHWYRGFAFQMGKISHADVGPTLVSGTRLFNSANIDLTVTQPNGGTALVGVGTPGNQFVVTDGNGNPVALNSTTPIDLTAPFRVRLTLAEVPTEPAPFTVSYRPSPDTTDIISSGIYDNVTDGDGLSVGRQLCCASNIINVIAPQIVVSVAAISNTTVGTTIPVSGTYSNGVLTAVDYSVDSGTTWITPGSSTITGTTFSFSISAGLPVGLYSVMVRDHTTLGSGGSAPFTVAPTSSLPTAPVLSSPLLSFDATSPVGSLFADAAETTQAVIGQGIGALHDTGDTGNDWTQTTATARPVYQANVKNGLPGLRFTGTASQLLKLVSSSTLLNTLKASAGYTTLVVFTPNTITANADIVSLGQGAAFSNNHLRLAEMQTSAVLRTGRSNDNTLFYTTVAGGAVAGTLTKAVTRYDGTNLKLAVNALTEGSTAGSSVGTVNWDYGYIGASRDGNANDFFLDGWVHEIRIWNVGATDSDRDDLLAYATSKWGN